ncbi:metallophosphoesterase family protein [Ferruginivarius sediminum]|uniref:DNA repair exonuclease n=1 Tax=Ferruginivarius sediminum TaxID=2661937 RepID=A0A369T9V3_9PROT|nr:DNA repair exonuclease [Ferruginivarius sediminum]RDD62068.1 DNA repair exonuclease [Ferruginivarius sediminum]
MARFTFVHAADLHLDTPFDGLSRLGDEVPARLRDASLRAWDNLVEETLRVEAAFLVLAGDIYDGPERGLRAQLRFRDGLRRLSEAGVRIFMVHGNHDPVEEGWSAIAEWPEAVTVFPTDEVRGEPVIRDGRRIATIYGISYARRETTDNLARLFPTETPDGFSLGLLHCNVGNNAEHAAYSPCSLDDLRAAAIDYWALGHIHQYSAISEGSPWAVYAGALQGRSPKPSETGPKGAVVVEVEEGKVRDLKFRPLDVFRFETRALDIGGVSDMAGLHDALQELGAEVADTSEGRQMILRAKLEGRGPVHLELRRAQEALPDLLRELREAGGGGDGVWWDRLIDRTAPPIDKEAIRQRGDFSAELLMRADALLADSDALEAFIARHCRPGDRRLRGLLGEVDEQDAREILSRAVDEALDRVESGEAG